MKFLFFLVHPSKFHVFRQTINSLIERGHQVDLLIISKDILEELVKREGWDYTNIFPEGRKIKGVSPYISSGINFFRTIFRLFKFTSGKGYDLFISDDLLGYVGKWKKVPSMTFVDTDLSVVKQFALVLRMTDFILAPEITDLGKFNFKKIPFDSYKELAYLHPNQFVPNLEVVRKINPELKPFFILRLVNLGAYHDVGKKGLSNSMVRRLVGLLEKKGRVFISSERSLPDEFANYQLKIDPLEIGHVLYFAEMYIGDSQTMTSEAAVLGTPTFRCNDFVGKISVMEEKEEKYHLSFNYPPTQFDEMFHKIETLLSKPDYREVFSENRKKMLAEKIDLSAFLLRLFGNFPDSIKVLAEQPDCYNTFCKDLK